jgi:methylated-DNA-protein-cysteine methyltransferase related protein
MNPPSRLDEILLDMVRMIPPGKLASYADLSALAAELGYPCTARRVARTLSLYGSDVQWWRVVQSAGTVADQVYAAAVPRLEADGVQVQGRRVPLELMRWDPEPTALRQHVMQSANYPVATPPPV